VTRRSIGGRVRRAVLLAAIIGGWPTTPAAAQEIDGYWRGRLELPGGQVTIALVITRRADGQLSAVLDSPDQGATGIPVSTVTLTGQRLRAEVQRIGGVFEGALEGAATSGAPGAEPSMPARDRLVGEWRQGGRSLPLTLERREAGERVLPNRPQEPRPPYPYRVEEVRYQNERAGVTRAGTLTLPTSAQPVPAVLLLSGSGPQDRDESLAGHRPFLVLADHLTRQGIAVLRVDDRGVDGSTGDRSPTLADQADDAVAGVAFLSSRPEIDAKRIGLIGHSEGGVVAPLAATKSPVAFLVLLAGTGVPGEQVLYTQAAALARAAGAAEARIQQQRAQMERLFTVLKTTPDRAAAEAGLRAILAPPTPDGSEAARVRIDGQVRALLEPWYRALLVHDPRPVLRAVTVPVLAINGEHDLQVSAAENLAGIEEQLRAGGNKDVTVRTLPGLNHLFQTSATGAVSEYSRIEETFAPAALTLVSEWIRVRTHLTDPPRQ
jgi:uncharacterized protein